MDPDNDRENAMLDLVETISTCSYELGIIMGYERLNRWLSDLAGKEFAAGNDDKAKAYREIAREIFNRAVVNQENYDTKLKPEKDAAFDELRRLYSGK